MSYNKAVSIGLSLNTLVKFPDGRIGAEALIAEKFAVVTRTN